MAEATQWAAIQKTLKRSPPLSIEDLQRFSSGDIDPWTLTLGQALCERFKFAPLGHRNIGSALHNLPGEQFSQQQFEIGYGTQHIIHYLLRSADGVALAAIVGVLAEYFKQDFVVDFFLLLAKKSKVPESLRPLERQWRRVVQVLYGVLAISTFGQCSMLTEVSSADASGDFDLEHVVNAMEIMSQVTQKREKGTTILCGPEVPFLAAVATWLFDLKYKVEGSQSASALNETGSTTDTDVIFSVRDASYESPADSLNTIANALPNYRHSIDVHGNAGRVPFERIFQTTFGTNFTRIKDETLSAYIAGAARMMQDNLDSSAQPRFGFLSHRSDSDHGPGFGFVQTMLGWFPELRRLSPRLERISKLSADEARARFIQAVAQLQTDCQCADCSGSGSAESRQVCLITMLELVISMGIYVTRMIVSPRLYPKVKGIWKLYDRLSETRRTQPKVKGKDPAEDYMHRIGRYLPTSVDMLKIGALLFTNSQSREIDDQPNLMGITHSGLTIYLNGGFKDNADTRLTGRGQAALTIRIVPGWMCLFGHEARMEVYEQGSLGWTFEECWEQVRLRTESVQMLKWKGDIVLSCLMRKNEQHEAQSEAQGWLVLRC